MSRVPINPRPTPFWRRVNPLLLTTPLGAYLLACSSPARLRSFLLIRFSRPCRQQSVPSASTQSLPALGRVSCAVLESSSRIEQSNRAVEPSSPTHTVTRQNDTAKPHNRPGRQAVPLSGSPSRYSRSRHPRYVNPRSFERHVALHYCRRWAAMVWRLASGTGTGLCAGIGSRPIR
jgi:hypothetical protein